MVHTTSTARAQISFSQDPKPPCYLGERACKRDYKVSQGSKPAYLTCLSPSTLEHSLIFHEKFEVFTFCLELLPFLQNLMACISHQKLICFDFWMAHTKSSSPGKTFTFASGFAEQHLESLHGDLLLSSWSFVMLWQIFHFCKSPS